MNQLTASSRHLEAGVKQANEAVQRLAIAFEAVTPVTARQQAVCEFIKGYIAKHGYSPTYREIGAYFEIAPKNARQHILALEAKGILSHTEGTARSIVMGHKSYPLDEPENAVE